MRRPASVDDVHRVAMGMPHTTVESAGTRRVYQVGGRSFVFFRNPRPDAVDAGTGERLDDVIVIWVESQEAKTALLQDDSLPLFTTAHFDGHPSVLVRASRVGEMPLDVVEELVQEAWLSRASRRRGEQWLAGDQLASDPPMDRS